MILTLWGDLWEQSWNGGKCGDKQNVCWTKKNYSHTPLYGHPLNMDTSLERFSYDLDMKTREQNRNNKRTEIERFDWFIERIQTRVAFGGLFLKLHARELSRNQPILRFEVILQHDSVTIGQSNNAFSIIISVFFGGKAKRPCFDLFTYWLIKQTTKIALLWTVFLVSSPYIFSTKKSTCLIRTPI